MEDLRKQTDWAGVQVIRNDYEKAFKFLYEGQMQDHAGHQAWALQLYQRARRRLLHGVCVPTMGEACSGSEWDSARQMQQKMMEALSNINTRLATLDSVSVGSIPAVTTLRNHSLKPPPKKSQPMPGRGLDRKQSMGIFSPIQPGVPGELPPAYTCQAMDGHITISYGTQVGERSLVGNRCFKLDSCPEDLRQSGQELLFIPRGVQIFFVAPDGQVSTPSYPGYLRIVKLTNQLSDRTPNCPPAFLQVCNWVFSLSPDSPVLLCNSGVFMFPDTRATTPGSYVGVVLSSELPLSDRKMFEDQLLQLTDLRMQVPDDMLDTLNLSEKVPLESTGQVKVKTATTAMEQVREEKPVPEWSEKVARGFLSGASWLSRGLVKGGEYTGNAIHKGGAKLREHITPEDEPAEVNSNVTKGLHFAKQATGGAVKAGNFLVDGACTVATGVGRQLGPHVKKHGSRLVPESVKKGKEGNSNVSGAMHVASSSMQGLATVWSGLEVGSKCIGKSMASETISTVKHKYGEEAAQATKSAVHSTLNVGIAAFTFSQLALNAFMKTVRGQAPPPVEDPSIQEKNGERGKTKEG